MPQQQPQPAPLGKTEAELAGQLCAAAAIRPVVHVAANGARAARIAALARADLLPGWDCLPFDRAPPSRAVMGLRMALVGRCAQGHPPRLLITSIAALLQRLPPPDAHKSLRVQVGAEWRAGAIRAALHRLGYLDADVADLPGEAVMRGEIVDVLPPDGVHGIRIEHLDGRIVALREYDPQTQRSLDADTSMDAVVIPPASELLLPAHAEPPDDPAPEHRLSEHYDHLVTLFALMPDAVFHFDPEADEARANRLAEIAECFRDRLRFGTGTPPCPPEALYLQDREFDTGLQGRVLDDLPPADVVAPVGMPAASSETGAAARRALLQPELRIGDAVVHLDHGMGALRGIETIEADGTPSDRLRLEYANGTSLVPVGELDLLWRYGADADAVTLDRLDDRAWPERLVAVEREMAVTAEALAALIAAREQAAAPVINPPARKLARIADRFAYPLTGDQTQAVADVLADLRSGRPMDRLVCGDVGYGKTEVALRAAAAAALCGYQVAVLAPTTVLARQHLESFTRRFAGLGIAVAGLSRLSSAADAAATRAGIADGSVAIAVGTHALAARNVRFKRLGLVIVDEEQRFGTQQKAALRAMGHDAHVLTLTATPIPRTLQSAIVGLQDLSVIATPPRRRRPVRSHALPFDPATVRAALEHEHRRGGQSFVVAPRIEDLPDCAPS